MRVSSPSTPCESAPRCSAPATPVNLRLASTVWDASCDTFLPKHAKQSAHATILYTFSSQTSSPQCLVRAWPLSNSLKTTEKKGGGKKNRLCRPMRVHCTPIGAKECSKRPSWVSFPWFIADETRSDVLPDCFADVH